ncbi:MAG: hypothetical protein GX199_04100 [Firmicutes bacterium]|nr:hypothetical protein [Bacillota bacterium]
MDLQEVMARLNGDRDELVRAALRCSSAGELSELAAERGLALPESEAEELLALLQLSAGELTEAELDAVTGGFSSYKCPECRSPFYETIHKPFHGILLRCKKCGHMSEPARWS